MSSLQAIWTDTNGAGWDLMGGQARLAQAGLVGLGLPEFDDQIRQYANQDGQQLNGWTLKPRKVVVPFRFKGGAEVDVEGAQRAFWGGLAIGKQGTLLIRDSSGNTRTLRMRIQDDGGVAYKADPYLQQPDVYSLTFVADQPWWLGPDQSFSFSLGDTTGDNFYGGGDGSAMATPFYILPSSGGSAQTVTNPGDVPAWPKWTLQGPLSAFDLAVNGHHITANMTLGASDVLVIATDPTKQSATLNGNRLALRSFSALDFAAIPAMSNYPVSINVTGQGLATVAISPRFARAF